MNNYKPQIVFWDRLWKVIFVVVSILILAITIINARQNQIVIENLQRNSDETQRSLRCIGEYFTQSNRANLRIQDINDCTLVRN